MPRNPVLRWAALAATFVLVTGGGCGSDTVNVTSVVQPTPNGPPTIVTQGPQYSRAPIELMLNQNPPSLYFLVADPNGLDDISVGLLSIDTVLVHRVIARPVVVAGCRQVTFTDNDTVALALPSPLLLPGLENCAMSASSGGYFSLSPFSVYDYSYYCRAFSGFASLSQYFAQVTSGCTFSGSYYALFLFDPPTAPPVEVFITSIEVEFRGISVTVYDAAGASAVATFPPIRLVYTSREEKAAAP